MESCGDLLTNDHSGQGLKALKEEIFAMHNTLKSSMDKGLSHEEAQVAMQMKAAIDQADELLDVIYSKKTS